MWDFGGWYLVYTNNTWSSDSPVTSPRPLPYTLLMILQSLSFSGRVGQPQEKNWGSPGESWGGLEGVLSWKWGLMWLQFVAYHTCSVCVYFPGCNDCNRYCLVTHYNNTMNLQTCHAINIDFFISMRLNYNPLSWS